MSRCQHCQKLTHSEDLVVEYEAKDHGKIIELTALIGWVPKYMYDNAQDFPGNIYGKLKCGDIFIHFRMKTEQVIE